MKYFYTDPLAAAWMQKHFGMKFYWREKMDDGSYLSKMMPTEYEIWIDRKSPVKFYIQPDSEYILEPQLNDFVTFNGKVGGRISDVSKANKDAVIYSDEACLIYKLHELIIIQRNGIAFMRPQTDA